jgi:hypothetical protein
MQELDIKGLALNIINNASAKDRFIKLKIAINKTIID